MININEIKVNPIPITLDKERTLLYDLNAFAELELSAGSNLQEVLEKVSKGSFTALRALLWAGLIHEDKNLQEKEVGALIGLNDLVTVVEAISKALNVAMPESGIGLTQGEH